MVPIRCDHVWRESSFEKEGKNSTASSSFSNKSSGSHTVWYYGEVRDMFDDFRVGAAGDLPHPQNPETRLCFNLLLCSSGLFFAIFFLYWLVFPSSVFLHLNVCIFCRMSADKALAWSVFHSRASSFRSQTSIFELQVGKWKQLLFEIGYMSHETTMAMI